MAEEVIQQEDEIKPVYAGARGTAVKILNRIERTDAYMDKLLDIELKLDELSNVDKSLLAELVHGVMRWQGRLDYLLNSFTHGNFSKTEINLKNTLRVALYQILFLTRMPNYAAVNEAVEFIKRLRGEKTANFVNAVLRNVIRNINDIQYPKRDENQLHYLSVFFSHPQWMVKRWLPRFDIPDLEKFLIANNEIPPLTLRINKLKITPGEFLVLLDKEGIQYEGSQLIDFFIRVKTLTGIAQLDIFRQGYFSVQDESQALPVLLLAPQSGERVIDMCAAPGGKSTLIGELMKNKGEIISVDKFDHKLNLLKTSCERLGITNVKTLATDASTLEIEPAEKVLLDAPCSGLGTLRKKPDMKWKREIEDIQVMVKLQEQLLERAAHLVKPGGVLVYSTCTTEPEENEMQIKKFVEQHPEFHIDNASKFVNKNLVNPDGLVMTFPHRHHIDGGFAARLIKDF
ncbi:MAG: 16S rRNA (cytosine(967)-C(5))-methyltransferase RsmB [Ignavibacteriae bacterium]|nr:16S rRNA (cytosine(967)-C(5))-methyltransferase RsmB [Ignavibacteriota bacterium]